MLAFVVYRGVPCRLFSADFVAGFLFPGWILNHADSPDCCQVIDRKIIFLFQAMLRRRADKTTFLGCFFKRIISPLHSGSRAEHLKLSLDSGVSL